MRHIRNSISRKNDDRHAKLFSFVIVSKTRTLPAQLPIGDFCDADHTNFHLEILKPALSLID